MRFDVEGFAFRLAVVANAQAKLLTMDEEVAVTKRWLEELLGRPVELYLKADGDKALIVERLKVLVGQFIFEGRLTVR